MRRHVAPALAGLCLAMLPAGAAASTEAQPTVVFNGSGLGVLLCSSNPDRGAVTTTAGTWINVVNHTGFASTLRIGQASIPVASGEGKAVSLAPGRYQLQMIPSCGLNLQDAGSVAVEVAAARPAPPVSSRSAGTRPATAAPRVTGPGPVAGPTAPVPAAPGRTAAAARPGASPAAAPTATDPTPPPTDAPTAEPLAGVPSSAPAGGDVVAVQDFVPTGMTEPARANRLLALIATICVIGVTIAAIRAIMAQRTGRSAPA